MSPCRATVSSSGNHATPSGGHPGLSTGPQALRGHLRHTHGSSRQPVCSPRLPAPQQKEGRSRTVGPGSAALAGGGWGGGGLPTVLRRLLPRVGGGREPSGAPIRHRTVLPPTATDTEDAQRYFPHRCLFSFKYTQTPSDVTKHGKQTSAAPSLEGREHGGGGERPTGRCALPSPPWP